MKGQMIDAQTWYQTIGANGTGYVGSIINHIRCGNNKTSFEQCVQGCGSIQSDRNKR